MKKIFYYILPLLAVAACSKEQAEVKPQPSEGVYSLTVMAPESPEVTKSAITYENSRYKFIWENGDKISAGTNNISNALSGVTPDSEVITFTFSKAVSNGDFVRCPGVENPSSVVIPAAQTSVGGQYDPAANPIWGTVNITGTEVPYASVNLHNGAAMLKFSLTSSSSAQITSAVIEAIGEESLNGNFTMNTSTGAMTPSGSNSPKTTINFSSPLALSSTPVDLYIPVRPKNYTQGFKLVLNDASGKYMQVSFFKTGQTLTNANLAEFAIAYAASRVPVEINPIGVLGAVESSYDDDMPANGLRIGTYNVWSDRDREDKIGSRDDKYVYRTWDYAGSEVAATIASMDCDVIGINEISSNMYASGKSASLEDAVKAYTSEYTYSLNWPNAVDESWWRTSYDYTYCNGFIYKGDKLTLNASGKFWLNSSGSTSSDDKSGGKRTCVWAKFTQKSTSKVFYVAVAHLSIESQGSDDGAAAGEWNLATAKNLISYLKTRSGATNSDRIILLGDMNASNSTTNKGFQYIVNTYSDETNSTLPFTDARDYLASQNKLSSSENGYPGTSVGQWNMGSYLRSESHRYDHIMYRNVTVSNYKSYRKTFTVGADASNTFWYPSDHIPISADFVL